MTINFAIISVIALLLFGCSQEKEIAKIQDFAGIIFIFFSIIVIVQLITDKIISSSLFKKFENVIVPIRKILPILAKFSGMILFGFGFFSDGLKRINVFIGIILILFGFFMKKYNESDYEDKKRSIYAKLMVLCLTFGISLFFLMTSALDHIKL